MSKLVLQETTFTEQKDIREQFITKVEVLDKIKSLFLIPQMEVMTVKMVAEYFEVGLEAIKSCYKDHKIEVDEDGVVLKAYTEFSKVLGEPLKTGKGKATYMLRSDNIIDISTRGVLVFPKRAILRIAMLLRDSVVAKEVRTQLLNTFEKTTVEQKTEEIDNEQKMLINIAQRYLSGTKEEFALATKSYIDYQNRYIKQVEEEKQILSDDNKLLAGETLKWADRACLNKAVRILAAKLSKLFGVMFNELYDELRYKHSIGLSQRGNQPYIQHIREDEWSKVIQSFSALCESYKVNPSKILKKAKVDYTNEVSV